MHNYAAFLGIDWADRKHDLCLIEAGSGFTSGLYEFVARCQEMSLVPIEGGLPKLS